MSEHVEVLRVMRDELPLADGESAAIDAAIAALSAPAEAQPVEPRSGVRYFVFGRAFIETLGDPDKQWVVESIKEFTDAVAARTAELDSTLPPPSAPVGVEGLPPDVQEVVRKDDAAWALASRAEAAGAERDESDDDLWWTLRIEQFKALAQQSAATQDDRFPGGLADAIRYADAMEEAAGALYQQVFGAETDGGDTGTDLLAAIARKVQQPAAVDEAMVAGIAKKLRKLRLTEVGGRRESPATTVKACLQAGLGGLYDDEAADYIVRAVLRYRDAALAAQQGGRS